MSEFSGATLMITGGTGSFGNTVLKHWADEASSLAQTHGLGVGFGTSYASASFVMQSLSDNPSGPFFGDANYSAVEKLYVLGSHNSFVSIAFRMGLLGVLLFVLMLQSIYESRNRDCDWSAESLLFHCAILIVTFNVGLESPLYLFTFLFCVCNAALHTSQHEQGELDSSLDVETRLMSYV